MSCIDLKQKDSLCVKIDKGVTGQLSFDLSALPSMDSGYTLILDEEQDTQQIYTVGSGLTINTTTVVWDFSTELSESKTYLGRFESDSQTIGTYVRFYLTVEVSE